MSRADSTRAADERSSERHAVDPPPTPLEREPSRATTSIAVKAIVAVLLLAALAGSIWLAVETRQPGESGLSIAFFLMFSAAVGGSIDLSFRTTRLLAESNKATALLNIVWKLLVSMALALTTYILFQSGIVQGSLFPQFASVDDSYTNMIDYLNNVKPLHNVDTAKALVWSFIAGYSERFVPDMLSKVRARNGD